MPRTIYSKYLHIATQIDGSAIRNVTIYGIRLEALSWIRSFLNSRKHCVSIGGVTLITVHWILVSLRDQFSLLFSFCYISMIYHVLARFWNLDYLLMILSFHIHLGIWVTLWGSLMRNWIWFIVGFHSTNYRLITIKID